MHSIVASAPKMAGTQPIAATPPRSMAHPPQKAPIAIPRFAQDKFIVMANAGARPPAIVTRTWLSVTPAVWVTLQMTSNTVGAFLMSSAREFSRIDKPRAEKLAQGAHSGEIDEGVNVEAVALFLITVHQGMSIQARDGASRQKLEEIAHSALVAWQALTNTDSLAHNCDTTVLRTHS
jgi:hypothetical protein